MLFNSYIFIFAFLPIILIGYFWLLRQRLILGSKIWLVGGSLFFYGYWSVVYIPLLLASILVNFFVGSAFGTIPIKKEKLKGGFVQRNFFNRISKKQLLIFGIIFNIGLLSYFKYTDFFLENFNGIFTANIPLPHIILPLGISFFTFTQIAFLVDSYKNEVKEYDLLHYMLFVTYFPHLLAGPILHHKEMMPQFANKLNMTLKWKNIALGIFIFSIGLFKKVIIADTFANWVNLGYSSSDSLNFLEAWATSLSYTLQLYFDFSGYVDMAIGISIMFNIILPINFNSPYKAKNIQDFWKRWHITLSRFLRDYVYIPLGGNKVSPYKNYFNLFVVFFIGGIWHGASWMFIIWGSLHGVAIVIHRIWKDLGFTMWKWLGWFITFNFVNITWIFFRAENLDQAFNILRNMFLGDVIFTDKWQRSLSFLEDIGIEFGQFMIHLDGSKSTWIWIIGAFLLFLFTPNSHYWFKSFKASKIHLTVTIILLLYSFLHISKNSEFLYFNF